jgi:hypothetical protein
VGNGEHEERDRRRRDDRPASQSRVAEGEDGHSPEDPRDQRLVVGEIVAVGKSRPVLAESGLLHERSQDESSDGNHGERPHHVPAQVREA